MDSSLKLGLAVLFLCSCIAAGPAPAPLPTLAPATATASSSGLAIANGYYAWYKRPCKQNDPNISDCLLRAARVGLPETKNGDPKRHLPSINPFFLPQMEIRTGSDQVGLKFNMKNVNIYGLPDIEILGLKLDMKGGKADWTIKTKTINLDGDYVASGKILILPVTGDGKFQFSLRDMKCRIKSKFELVKKADGKQYLNFTQVEYRIDDIKHVKYTLQNLFKGDKLLGGQILTFINQNWREVFEEVRPGIEQTMSEVLKFLMSPLTRAPFDYIFPPS